MSTPVILDCDPGHDDALAILLAHAAPEIDLLAITTVAGNQTLDKCTRNAQLVMTHAGIDVPLAQGEAAPLAGPLRTAGHVHGASGLDGYEFGPPRVDVREEHAVDLCHRLLVEHPEPVTLVPTGPLTNVAVLLQRHPQVRERIAEIVLMGGSTGRGNTTPYAEANIYVDPEAARAVFDSGVPVTMVGLNVTHQAMVTADILATVRDIGTPVAEACAALLTFYGTTYDQLWGFAGPPLHDPVAVARVVDPALVECVRAPVRIETAGEHTRGATVVDLDQRVAGTGNALVAVGLQRERFWERMIGALRAYG